MGFENRETLALIPARAGSKGIPHKNIASFRGKPMLAHSVLQARQSRWVDRVIVSTDSQSYAAIAREYGAETPFLRPPEFAGDHSTDLAVFRHALEWLAEHDADIPEICVHLRPTFPTRRVEDIDKAIELLCSDPGFDSVRTLVRAPETPFKMWFLGQDGELKPVVESNIEEPYNMPRQALPEVFLQNANVDVVWSRVILEQNSMTGNRIRGMVMADCYDIDDAAQFEQALGAAREPLSGKRFVVDIDGIIATLTPRNDYSLALPISNNITLINQLYDLGNTIILFTARGTLTGQDWKAVTREQLAKWGVKYHELCFGKPAADYYIDDRFIQINELEKLLAYTTGTKGK